MWVTNSYGQHPVEEQSVANWGPPCALFQSTPMPETNSVKASYNLISVMSCLRKAFLDLSGSSCTDSVLSSSHTAFLFHGCHPFIVSDEFSTRQCVSQQSLFTLQLETIVGTVYLKLYLCVCMCSHMSLNLRMQSENCHLNFVIVLISQDAFHRLNSVTSL